MASERYEDILEYWFGEGWREGEIPPTQRKVWYAQEHRPPPPILCTYLGRADRKSGRPFRFILNQSNATAANVYLLLYPKPVLTRALERDPGLLRRMWKALNSISAEELLGEGRVYGGGLHKLEPKELGNVRADARVTSAAIPWSGIDRCRCSL